MNYECVPLYDSLGENAVEYIIDHAEAVAGFVDSKKLPLFLKALGSIGSQFKHVVYWGAADAASVEVGAAAAVGGRSSAAAAATCITPTQRRQR